MAIKNKAQLKKVLLDKCTNAVDNAGKKVYEEIAGNLNQFYYEYNPDEYIRTGALYNSLEYGTTIPTNNGAIAEIGFDVPHYKHGLVPIKSGGYGFSYWDDEYILDVAMTGRDHYGRSHGGWTQGTLIWTESMQNLGGEQGIKNLLKQELKKQGL